jgi:hypothetical protein
VHYQFHFLLLKEGTAGGSTYGSHNHILNAVALCAGEAGLAYSLGENDNNAGTYTTTSTANVTTTHSKHSDIAFPNMPADAFKAQRVLGDVTLRNAQNKVRQPRYTVLTQERAQP